MDGPPAEATAAKHSRFLLVIAYVGFVGLGLPDTVIGVAWPSVRERFSLPQSGLGLISIAGGIGYFVSSFLAGRLTNFLGVGVLLAVSSGLIAATGFGYALTPFWSVFLGCALVAGLGSGAIDAGLNRFVASHFSARHVNWLHACYSFGATGGPLLMTFALVSVGSWRWGFAAIGTAMTALTILLILTCRRWEGPAEGRGNQAGKDDGLTVALKHPVVWMQAAIFFLYTGLELTVGHWSFTLFTESRNIPTELAGMWVGIYFGSIGVGRVLFGFVADRVGVDRLIRFTTLGAVLGAVLLAFGPPQLAGVVAPAGIGLALAPIYPCLMSRTPQRLEPEIAKHAFGFQVSAAMLGAAVMPGLAGLLVEKFGLEIIGHFIVVSASSLLVTLEVLIIRTNRT